MYHYLTFSDVVLPFEVDPDNPIQRHETDCTIYFNYRFPMKCGEGFAFSNQNQTCVPEELADC